MKGFNFFYTGLYLPTYPWQIYYDFNESGSGVIPSVASASANCSGILSSLTNFYQNSGSGYFSGQNIQIANANFLSANNFTMFFVYEKDTPGNGVLFSSLASGGANVSGFLIGINDANRLYFEAYDQNGPQIYTSSNIYGSKNAIAVVKSNNILQFQYFNFNYQALESEQFYISTTALYQSNQAYLGAPINAPAYITQNNFTGYFDQFVYINTALTPNTVETLFSGFFASKIPNTPTVVGITENFITGAAFEITGIGTGITGFNTYFSGYVYDCCGNSLPVYSYNNLTGTILDTLFIPLINSITFYISGTQNNGYAIDSGYCNSFGMEGINYLLPCASGHASEIYVFPQIGTDFFDNTAQYNSDGTFKLPGIYNNNQIEVYWNGLSVFPSGYYTSGNTYISTIYLQSDYIVTGQSIYSSGAFSNTDTVSYDLISGIKELYYISGNKSQNFFTNNTNNRLIFEDGIKLISGIDFTMSGNYIHLINPILWLISGGNFFSGFNNCISGGNFFTSGQPIFNGGNFKYFGVITNFPEVSGFNYYSGYFQNKFMPKFARDSSQVWLSGNRQLLDIDYIEISKVDLLSGNGLFEIFTGILYNNNTAFMETW